MNMAIYTISTLLPPWDFFIKDSKTHLLYILHTSWRLATEHRMRLIFPDSKYRSMGDVYLERIKASGLDSFR